MGCVIRAAALVFALAVRAAGQDVAPVGVEVGASLPSFRGTDLAGRPVTSGDLLGKGTVVFSFWSVHCGDCLRELDDLRLIRKEFSPSAVTVVAVNTDPGYPVARIADLVRRYEAAKGEPLGVTHLLDRDASVLQSLGIRYIPLMVVCDSSGRVTSLLSGYESDDKSRIAEAMQEGGLALGAWSDDVRTRLTSILRSGSDGKRIEWGTLRVEEAMSLFGLYDSRGWLADAAGRRDRSAEVQRVEAVVGERLKVALLRAALGSLDLRFAPAAEQPFQIRGAQVPEGPLSAEGPWRQLYEAVEFDELYKEQQKASRWVKDDYWAALVGDVDLGALRQRLDAIGVPREPRRIRLEMLSDFDFKARALFGTLQHSTFRLQRVDGREVFYYGDAGRLAEEIKGLDLPDFKVYVEVPAPDVVRVEIF